MPTLPTEEMCDAARGFIRGLQLGINTYEGMITNLRRAGEPVPDWLSVRVGNLTKWDIAECIWLFMEAERTKVAISIDNYNI